jgi:ferric-dicitrate binding protein FerR (iron transport regulator)
MDNTQESYWEKMAGKLHGELSEEDEVGFNELISDQGHLKEFNRVQGIKDSLSQAGSWPIDSKAKSWNKVQDSIRWTKVRWISAALKYAALVVVAFVSGMLLNSNLADDTTLHFSEIHIPYGQMGQITLSDGTQAWLNSGTTLRYPDHFGSKSRSVEVIGEAFFKVAKMAEKPFTVNSTDLKIEVLGTSFNFSAYQKDNISSVTLVEGKVSIQDNGGVSIAQLRPGQIAQKVNSSQKLEIKEINTSSYSAWTEGKMLFEDERLDQIAVKLERWFNVEISFADPELKSRRFTGTILKYKPVDQIMQALELLAPIKFIHKINTNGKDQITIFKRT